MKKLLIAFAAVIISIPAMADHHGEAEAEVRAASEAFNTAYSTNNAEEYFSFYTDDAVLFFFGKRQVVAEYNESWSASIAAGGGVIKNDLSDMQLQMLPGGKAAVASYFVDNQSRSPDGDVSSATAYESEVWEKIDGEWKIVNLHYTEFERAE